MPVLPMTGSKAVNIINAVDCIFHARDFGTILESLLDISEPATLTAVPEASLTEAVMRQRFTSVLLMSIRNTPRFLVSGHFYYNLSKTTFGFYYLTPQPAFAFCCIIDLSKHQRPICAINKFRYLSSSES